MDILYERIKELRKSMKMTQEDLAALTGYDDRSSISKIEKGLVDLSIDKVKEFAKALGCSAEYLMGWDTEYPQNPYIYHLNSIKLQELIQFNRISIEELADKVDVIPVYMNSIVYESVSVDLETANKIADTLNVHLDDILDGISHSNIVRAPSPQFADIKDAITSLSTSELKELYLKIDNELDKREALDQYDESLQHEPIEDNKTSSDFKNILETYIESDDLTKAMVRRTLGIDSKREVVQELEEPDLDLDDYER